MGKGKTKREKRNKYLQQIKYIYLVLFALLILNLVRFVFIQSDDLIINPFNSRLSEIEENIVRGNIYDKNMVPLAQTISKDGENTRIYPFENKFAHIIGYSTRGKTGLEGIYNTYLLQSNTSVFNRISNDISDKMPEGNHLVTTLDKDLQLLAYDLLGERKGSIIAMNPSTGKILCMVSKPDFNPNYINENWDDLDGDIENSPFLNRGTQGLYPPGSTFKIITAMEYLQEHSEESFHYNCRGEDYFGDRVIRCYHNKKHGELDLKNAFAQSCNTSFAHIGEDISPFKLEDLCNSLGFNNSLPIDLPYSISEFNLSEESTKAMVVETAIGQGETLMSPMHNLLITSTVANGGILMKPYMVDRIIDSEGEVIIKNLPEMEEQVIDTNISSKITEYMEEVVRTGTGKFSGVEGVRIAGKTGTAENNHGLEHAWYVGFAPVEQPTIAIVVLVENVGTSGEYSVPIAKEIFKRYFSK